MRISSTIIYQDIVQPCLAYLDLNNDQLAVFLTAVQSLHHLSKNTNTFGLYHISHDHHWGIWDNYLVKHPELASRIRGMASQRRFLDNPDLELIVNNGYATAIAAMIAKRNTELEHRSTFQYADLAKLWRTVNPNLESVILVNEISRIDAKLQKKAA
jgi:hypothetical protein